MEYKELGCCAGLQKRLECPSPFFLLPEGKARATKLLIFTVFGLLRAPPLGVFDLSFLPPGGEHKKTKASAGLHFFSSFQLAGPKEARRVQ